MFEGVDLNDKWAVLRRIKDELILKNGLVMDDVDEHKPWGAYYRFVQTDKEKFFKLFYDDLSVKLPGNSYPKFLVFEPGKKLSFQYHERREEIWKVLYGEIEAFFGPTDELDQYRTYQVGETFSYPVLFRHKGGATGKDWAIVAEIWKHTDDNNPSDEDDNNRIADDYGRA